MKITFGDFEKDENKSLEIGRIVYKYLSDADLELKWDETINSPIEIINFKWDKRFSEDKEYEIEGAYNLFTGVINEN